jgi:hypothetical protein
MGPACPGCGTSARSTLLSTPARRSTSSASGGSGLALRAPDFGASIFLPFASIHSPVGVLYAPPGIVSAIVVRLR